MRAKIVLLKRLFPFSIRDFLVTTVIFFCATGVCALLQHVNSIDGFAFPVFVLAVLLVTEARHRLRSKAIPEAFRGLPITLIAAAITSLSFMGFGGIVENLFNVTL